MANKPTITVSFGCCCTQEVVGVKSLNDLLRAHPILNRIVARKATLKSAYRFTQDCAPCMAAKQRQEEAAQEAARLDIRIVRHRVPMFGTESATESAAKAAHNATVPSELVPTGKKHHLKEIPRG